MTRRLPLALLLGVVVVVACSPRPAAAQERDDFTVWVTIDPDACTGTVARSGVDLEVWQDGVQVAALTEPGDVWSVSGPAMFTVILRTPKQVAERDFVVPGDCTTTTVPPPTDHDDHDDHDEAATHHDHNHGTTPNNNHDDAA